MSPESSSSTASAGPSAAAASPPIDLSVYVGEYPFDQVAGVRFLEQPNVQTAVTKVVKDTAIRTRVLDGDVTAIPIFSHDGDIVYSACEPENCSAHYWSIVIDRTGTLADVCYRNVAVASGLVLWFRSLGNGLSRSGHCPTST